MRPWPASPNELALNVLLASLTIAFLLAVVTLQPMATRAGAAQSLGRAVLNVVTLNLALDEEHLVAAAQS